MKHETKIVIEAIRLKELGEPTASISKKLGVAASTINDWVKKAKEISLNPESLRVLSEKEIDETLRPRSWSRQNVILPDYEEWLVKASAHDKSINTVYGEYLASVPKGSVPVSKATFYRELKRTKAAAPQALQDFCLLNSFAPGRMCMIDYSGDGVQWTDKVSGSIKTAQIFVGVLCYSGLIYCKATPGQKREDWFEGITGMFHQFDGVTDELWLDNSTPLVKKADKYDPVLSGEFKNLCEYYNTLGYAVEPGKSRHKALVENAVKQCQDRILAHFTKRKFFSINEINRAIEPLLERLNKAELTERPGSSRMSRYQSEEKHFLRPLPLIEYSAHCMVSIRKVQANNQIRIKNVRYNVPWGNVGKELLVKIDTQTREISFIDQTDGEVLAVTTLRSPGQGPEPQRKEFLPEELKPLVETREELLERIRLKFGDKAFEVAQRMAKPNNSLSLRHLRGMLSIGKNYDVDFMDKVYTALLKKTVVTFSNYREMLRRVEQEEGVRYRTKRLKHGSTLEVPDCRSVRGADYYKGRFNNSDRTGGRHEEN